MGGFFGVVAKTDCLADLYYGTDYHSHLGTKRGGIAVTGADGRITRSIHDITNAQFRTKFDDILDRFHGTSGIGVISDYEDQPLLISSRNGSFAIVTVGKITNMAELRAELFRDSLTHFSETVDGEPNPTELVAALIGRKSSLVEGIRYAQNRIEGSCSLMLLIDGTIYAARDRYGRTPLLVGESEGAMAASMESTAFPNLGYTLKHELGPGEIVQIHHDRVLQKSPPLDAMQICAFLWVYYGYPSSTYEGANTESVRYRNGALIAKSEKVDVDAVCGVPDSGVAHAIGYSNASGKPYQRAFVKYTPTWARSFMPQNQTVRDLVAKMKLVPVYEQIRGKKLLFCDDSIVRGTQFKNTAKRLYELGAAEVHMRSASPPLVYGCKYLNFSRSRSEMDLAARRAIAELEGGEPSEETLRRYIDPATPEYARMVESLRKRMNLTSLRYQTLDNLIQAIGLPREKICTYCFDGHEL